MRCSLSNTVPVLVHTAALVIVMRLLIVPPLAIDLKTGAVPVRALVTDSVAVVTVLATVHEVRLPQLEGYRGVVAVVLMEVGVPETFPAVVQCDPKRG